jgi:hypothetical protein
MPSVSMAQLRSSPALTRVYSPPNGVLCPESFCPQQRTGVTPPSLDFKELRRRCGFDLVAVVCAPAQDGSILALGTTVVPSGFNVYKIIADGGVTLSEIVVSPTLDRSGFLQPASVVFAHTDLGESTFRYVGLALIV